MRTRIKFCGMTRIQDVRIAVALGVDAIGLVFAARSPRRLAALQARELRRAVLSPFTASVALFLDNDVAEVQETQGIVRPDLLQFHGEESPQDCVQHGLPYLKAVPMATCADAASYAARYVGASGFVFDGHATGEGGGGGRGFDWSRLPRDFDRPLLLAGGLTANVFDAVCAVRPYAVDVSSGIESAPGVKDGEAMRRFVSEVRRADAALATEERND